MTNTLNTIKTFENVTDLIRHINNLKKKYPTAIVFSTSENLLTKVALGWVLKTIYPTIKSSDLITNLEYEILDNKENTYIPVIVLGE